MKSNKKIESCLIIGAGMSGLIAARRLHDAGIHVTLLDKGRNPGGRLATRRIDRAVCDHGAQFITARENGFRVLMDKLVVEGVAQSWAEGFSNDAGIWHFDGYTRLRGVGGMNSIAKHLAKDLEVRCSEQVTRLKLENGQWLAQTENGLTISSDALILTPPVPQSLALLDAGNFALPLEDRAALELIAYNPCLAVMVLLDGKSKVPEPGGVKITEQPAANLIAWIADNSQKGISSEATALTIHTTADFARRYWDAPHEEIAGLIIHAAERWIGAKVQSWQVHRWRYSQPTVVHSKPFLEVSNSCPLIFAGDGFGGPRVEGAAISGMTAAEHLLSTWSGL